MNRGDVYDISKGARHVECELCVHFCNSSHSGRCRPAACLRNGIHQIANSIFNVGDRLCQLIVVLGNHVPVNRGALGVILGLAFVTTKAADETDDLAELVALHGVIVRKFSR